MKLRRTTATVVTVATLTLGVGALAAPAGAQTAPATTGERACQLAKERWAKLVWADSRAREEYRETRVRQEWLANHGREEAAAKLDAKLDKLQQTHAALVEKAQALRERYEAQCGDLGEDLDPSALA